MLPGRGGGRLSRRWVVQAGEQHMQTGPKSKSKIQKYDELVLPEPWRKRWQDADVLEQLVSLEGDVYREQSGRKTVRLTLDGKAYFAKIHSGVGWHEILKNLLAFRLPVLGAQNEWRAIKRLEHLGIRTTPLVAHGRRGWNPARRESFVVTEAVGNTVSLEDFCREWPAKPPRFELKRKLIGEVAGIARSLHENGLNHRDFYLCHFLLDRSSGRGMGHSQKLRLFLIDLHRVQIRRNTPMRWRVKDIAGLYFSSMDIGLTQRDLLRFIRLYRNKPLKVSLREDRVFWRRVTRRGISLYREIFKKDPVVVC
jgi:heptose I phosphotransferase